MHRNVSISFASYRRLASPLKLKLGYRCCQCLQICCQGTLSSQSLAIPVSSYSQLQSPTALDCAQSQSPVTHARLQSPAPVNRTQFQSPDAVDCTQSQAVKQSQSLVLYTRPTATAAAATLNYEHCTAPYARLPDIVSNRSYSPAAAALNAVATLNREHRIAPYDRSTAAPVCSTQSTAPLATHNHD